MPAQVIPEFMPLETLALIQHLLADRPFTHQGQHPDTGALQWKNRALDPDIIQILRPRLQCHFGSDHVISPGTGVWQRCYVPFGIHTDSKLRMNPDRQDLDNEGVALLIPLHEDAVCNTVIWRETARDDQAKQKIFDDFRDLPAREIRNSRIGARLDLEFAWQDPHPLRKIYNHLELDLVFAWRLGQAVIWSRNQLHASSDFRRIRAYKDAITMFFE